MPDNLYCGEAPHTVDDITEEPVYNEKGAAYHVVLNGIHKQILCRNSFAKELTNLRVEAGAIQKDTVPSATKEEARALQAEVKANYAVQVDAHT